MNKPKLIKDIFEDYCVLDVETTGTYNTSEITEVGILKIRNHKITDRFSQLVKPYYSIPYEVTKLTGISNQMVQNMPKIYEIKNQILNFIGDDIIVGHNTNFDVRFLNREINACIEKYVDTLSFCRKLFPEMESHCLFNMSLKLNLTNSIHRALGDCITTYELYEYIQNKMKLENITPKELFSAKKR